MKIKQLQQPTGNTCVCTSIAMVTASDLTFVIEKFHDDYMSGKIDEFDILKQLGSYFIRQGDHNIVKGRIYIASVSSLNILGKTHSIVIDASGDRIVIFDPAKGKLDKKYYVWKDPESADEIELGGWSLVAEIIWTDEEKNDG